MLSKWLKRPEAIQRRLHRPLPSQVVSYLTALDVYVLACFALLVALTVESAFVARLRDDLILQVDTALAYGLGGAYALFNVLFAAAAWRASQLHSGRVEDGGGPESKPSYQIMASHFKS